MIFIVLNRKEVYGPLDPIFTPVRDYKISVLKALENRSIEKHYGLQEFTYFLFS